MEDYYSIKWVDGAVNMLDQRLLPEKIEYLIFSSVEEVAEAIRDMVIRGAPAIGSAAAYGLALTAQQIRTPDTSNLIDELEKSSDILRKSRPTAANLNWALNRIMNNIRSMDNADDIRKNVLLEAHKIYDEDVESNRIMGLNALELIPSDAKIIHHCNTGALATSGYGTALGAIRTAHENGKRVHVFVDETRPRLQGAKLTTWELKQLGIPFTLIVDGASGYFMRNNMVDLCLVGCDRVASNGDVANKIGTYNLAIISQIHQVPFYVVGPTSTIDMEIHTGNDILIEERPDVEITQIGTNKITPDFVQVANPAFDVTPSKYISAIITEKGIIYPPYTENIAKLMSD